MSDVLERPVTNTYSVIIHLIGKTFIKSKFMNVIKDCALSRQSSMAEGSFISEVLAIAIKFGQEHSIY